jgi:hypothetical protein
VRALAVFIAARQARASLEHLMALEHWPTDPAISRAIDRLVQLEEESAHTILRGAEARRVLWIDSRARGERWSA